MAEEGAAADGTAPEQQAGEQVDYDPEMSLWERVLAEHRANSSAAKARDVYQLFVLGDKNDGKEAVFKWLRRGEGAHDDEEEEEATSAGLSFNFGEWKEKAVGEDDESTVRVLQTLIEKPSMQYLLPAFYLNGTLSSRFAESSLFAITVDLSIPHFAMQRLEHWYKAIEATIRGCAGDDLDLQKRLQERTEAACDSFHTDPRHQQVKKADADECLEIVSPRAETTGRSTATYRKMGIFNKGNLGVPLIVVCTKTPKLDVVASQVTKEPKEKEHFLNYVQGNLRKWCIERGAALVYTDGERGQSDVLRQYLLYRLANIPMSSMLDERRAVARRVPAANVSHTSLFIPAFADSLPQVAKLQIGKYADGSWEQVVPAPKTAEQEAEEKAEVPDTFSAWLAKEKTKSKDGGLLGTAFGTREREGGKYSKDLNDIRKRAAQSATKSSKPQSLEATAESFFSNMIKTYRKQDKAPGRPRSSRTSGDDGKASPSASPPAGQ